jgi:sulfide:quinone oxidoreductase
MSSPRHVLIAGAGVAGLEAAMALRSVARDHVRITMLAPARHFTYRPLAVAEPFGKGRTVPVEVARVAADLGVELVRDALDAVQPESHTVTTQDGQVLPYDTLIVAL